MKKKAKGKRKKEKGKRKKRNSSSGKVPLFQRVGNEKMALCPQGRLVFIQMVDLYFSLVLYSLFGIFQLRREAKERVNFVFCRIGVSFPADSCFLIY